LQIKKKEDEMDRACCRLVSKTGKYLAERERTNMATTWRNCNVA
jgi:hypothetical protein